MSAEYEIWLSSPFATRRQSIPPEAIQEFSYTLTANAVGVLTMQVDRDAIQDAWVVPDAQIEVWRRPPGGVSHKEADAPFLLSKDVLGLTDDGTRYRTISAVTANAILGWRYVMYYANTASFSTFTNGAADDWMRNTVYNNMGTNANSSPLVTLAIWPSRLWTPYLEVDITAISAGPAVSKGFAWRSVLSTLQDIAQDAATKGTPVYFDVVSGVTTMFAFRVWIGARGIDRSSGANVLIISPERGSLGGTIERTIDYTKMATAVAVGGQGQDDQRVLGAAYDAARIGLSPFGLREHFMSSTQLSTTTALNAEASAELRNRRPIKTLTGTLISTQGAVYGIDWGFGDKIIAEFENESFVARVDKVTVSFNKGEEKVAAEIKGET